MTRPASGRTRPAEAVRAPELSRRLLLPLRECARNRLRHREEERSRTSLPVPAARIPLPRFLSRQLQPFST
jgi:hypothetical protein